MEKAFLYGHTIWRLFLKQKNYSVWFKGLGSATFLAAIANNCELTPAEEAKTSDWDKKNAKARMVISQCISQKV
jgi:hypothetical protein